MPIRRRQIEIQEWQTHQKKLQEAEVPGGTWYRDEAGQMRFKSNI
jgi:hypothetical protein